MLNGSLAEWYFRLGSTNAHVSQYQLDTLPCPRFGHGDRTPDLDRVASILTSLEARAYDRVESAVVELSAQGVGATIERVLLGLVTFIEERERTRGSISRAARSRLEPDANLAQVILDKAVLAMVGLGGRYEQIRQRLAAMV